MIVQFKDTVQVSPDDWERLTYTAEFDESATLKEVKDWAIKKYADKHNRMPDIALILPDKPTLNK